MVRTLLSLALLVFGVVGCGGPDLYGGMPAHVERRHVVLDGAANFRDLGGYAADDGRTVRWGRLFRSDALGDLSDRDLEKLVELDIALVCDFRSPLEVEEAPDRLPAEDPPEWLSIPILDDATLQVEIRERILSGDTDGFDWDGMLVEANRRFVTDYSPRYAAMFERITQPDSLPAVIHCTAGKDRAGFGAAAILRTLGVPEETVMEDFLLSNHYTAHAIERMLWTIRLVSLFRTDPEVLRPIFGVEPRYLQAAFDEIESRYGDFDTYRRQALGLSDEETGAFRNLMLERPGT